MQTIQDASKIKANEKVFVGEPLSNLLNEISPQIEMVSVIATESPKESPGYFFFRFQDYKTVERLKKKGKTPIGIIVYIKEPFEWDYKGRPADKKFAWTPDDVRRYSNLTVERIRVVGVE